jgi:hypothetical protein
MLLIRPLAITPAMVTASNAGSADADYNPATSYSLGQRVYLPDDGKTYECVQAPALGRYPPSNPLYWMPAAPSNRWAMWDAEISTASTTTSGTLTATVQPGARFNSVTFHGLVGSSITVVQKSSTGTTLWSETRSLTQNPASWYEYFFAARQQVREVVFTGLTPVTGSRLEITITGNPAACAAVVVGNSLGIGCAQYGFTRGIIDYSRKETASDGTQRLRQGRYSRRISGTVVNEIGRLGATLRALEDVRATPCVWIAAPEHGDLVEPLTVLGFYREFSQEVAGPTHTVCSLEIEGLSST